MIYRIRHGHTPRSKGRQDSPGLQFAALILAVACCLGSRFSVLANGTGGWFGMTLNVDAGGNPLSPTVHSAKVLAVAPNSPAAAAGLRTNDEILEIEGLTIAGGKAKELQAAMAKSVGDSLRMRLQHSGGETYAVVMTAVPKPATGS